MKKEPVLNKLLRRNICGGYFSNGEVGGVSANGYWGRFSYIFENHQIP